MTSKFKVVEHVIPGQHIREYPDSTRVNQEDVFRIAIKQYIPLDTPKPAPKHGLTIIALPGTGFPKETYEPVMEDLCSKLQSQNIRVRSIWMTESPNQGASGVLNEDILGESTNWFDHSRDLLQVVNHFRDQMPRPLIGFAHSLGCAQLVNLSIMHPRLLSTLVLCEPVILKGEYAGGNTAVPNAALPSSLRRDLWDSRETAEKALKKSFRTWNPRVLDSPNFSADAVTLTTTKHQEAWTFVQINKEEQDDRLNRLFRPDQDPKTQWPRFVVRPECRMTMQHLPHLRPSVLYIFGSNSLLSAPDAQDEKMEVTGVGQGGSGGVAIGKVQKVLFKNAGHLLPFEHVAETAQASSDWIVQWFNQWLKDEEEIRQRKNPMSDGERLRMSSEWLTAVRLPMNTPRPLKQKL